MDLESQVDTKKLVWELFVLSALSLFVELLVIRWLSSDIRMLSVFRTFPLVTCFVGLGVGFANSGKSNLFKMSLPSMMQLAITIKLVEFCGASLWRFPSNSTYYFQNLGSHDTLYLVVCLMVIVLILAGPFAMCACIGARLGVLFNQLKPLVAYSINIGGAILGSIAFGAMCFLGLPPELLLIISGLLIVWSEFQQKQASWKSFVGIGCLAGIVLIPVHQQYEFDNSPLYKTENTTLWSPYQRLDLSVFRTNKDNEFIGLDLGTNHGFYQYFFSDTLPLDHATKQFEDLVIDRRNQYSLAYRVADQAKDVLILGAGTGQNIAPALSHGAQNVDAVDIDPVILQIGKQFNPAYASSVVHPICDDARHFLKTTHKKYDLIIFTLLDSQAVVGQGSSVRLDTYVYTEQSVKQALSLLKPQGLVVMSFCCLPWIESRLYKTLEAAAGYPPTTAIVAGPHAWGTPDVFFFLGGPVERKDFKLPGDWQLEHITIGPETPKLTDDWPYLYVRPEVLDIPYLSAIILSLSVSFWAGRKFLFGSSDANSWQLFMLGAAFMLLELHAISVLSLIYGSTWLTSAIVINGILAMLWAANLLVLRFHEKVKPAQTWAYLGLFAAIIVSFVTPTQAVLDALPGVPGELTLAMITILPMGLAGLIFPIAFSENNNSAKALAFNLMGAVVGGLLEYLSNFIGIRNLELIALVLYLLSMLIRQPWKPSLSSIPQNVT